MLGSGFRSEFNRWAKPVDIIELETENIDNFKDEIKKPNDSLLEQKTINKVSRSLEENNAKHKKETPQKLDNKKKEEIKKENRKYIKDIFANGINVVIRAIVDKFVDP